MDGSGERGLEMNRQEGSGACSMGRREFVGATAALGVAGALSGVALADEAGEKATPADDWLGEGPQMPEEFAQELECDVVVCGLGYAGVSAVRAAVEAGASVVAFEKGSDFGLGSHDCCALGSSLFEERFPEIGAYWEHGTELLVNEISKSCLYRNNAALAKKWLSINGENVDWFVGAAPADSVSYGTSENGNVIDEEADYTLIAGGWPIPSEYDPYAENMPCLPGSFKMDGARDKAFLAANLDLASEVAGDGLQVMRDTKMVRLIKEDGRVTGVVAVDADGNYIKATALKGVVLATGDFMNDRPMLEEFLPNVLIGGYEPNGDYNYYTTRDLDGNSCNTGDGHRAAVWAGAKMQDYGCSMSHLVASGCSPFGTVPFLLLNAKGERFMNEDVQGQQYAERVRQLPGQRAYQIFDSAWPEQMPYMPYGHGKNPNATQEDIDGRIEQGSTVTADTLEELFALIDIDAEAALASVERYNELCAAGSDVDFGKTPSRMFALENPPYYASVVGRGDDLVTMSGIESDECCHALDANHDAVPGLYVAGNVQGGRFANIYPEAALGISVAMALAFGREAGTNAATGK